MAGALHQYLAGLTLVDRRLNMEKYVNDYKIILVYVEHGSSNVDTSIYVTPKKGVAMAVDNHIRNALIEIDSSLDSASSVEGPIVVESVNDPFEHLDEILGDYANTRKQFIGDEITGKQMVVHVGNNSTVNDVLDLEMLFETEGVGPIGKFKEVEVDADNESKEESGTEGNYTSGSDLEDSDYDPKHDEVFDDDEHIVEDVHVSINNFSFTANLKHNLSIGGVEVQEDDIDVINYDSFGSDLNDGIDSERRIQLRELRRIGKFLSDHIIKSLATNLDILVRVDQDQIFREQYLLIREYSQELISQNPGTTVRIDVQQEPNPESLTRTFRRVYVCLGALKQGFRAYGREILRLDGCFMSGPWPGQILTVVGVDVNNGIYPVAYAIVEAESKASWCWFLNLLGEDLGVFPSAEHMCCVRHIHENMKSQFKGVDPLESNVRFIKLN
ncbi:mutator type transposase [Tanacetum coccineum]